ncbi:hypothetical protein BGZ61DRAFT_458796 [Ilyonectria robusta]|uniref:uncharacterized protein n=1 Tax=Ilyonectria robusta TaxID=1079257 RepID=UPI001E8E0780|nr:uncharacterized protein BGZ61DRAFT_458796 [Ilyonectria robusta]KAH8673092.1 hypothetical protein BGZ61DRAFT_458796 [Ilyonectria robusta]
MPLGDGLLGPTPRTASSGEDPAARVLPRARPRSRWIEGPSRATLLQMEGLAVSSLAPPAGCSGWLGWTALHAIFSRAASVPSVPSQPYCVFVFTGCKPEGKRMSCTSYLAANELQSASGDELRWALTGPAGFAGFAGLHQGDSFGGDNASTKYCSAGRASAKKQGDRRA